MQKVQADPKLKKSTQNTLKFQTLGKCENKIWLDGHGSDKSNTQLVQLQ